MLALAKVIGWRWALPSRNDPPSPIAQLQQLRGPYWSACEPARADRSHVDLPHSPLKRARSADQSPRQPNICNLGPPVPGEKDIRGLHVEVNYVVAVEVPQAMRNIKSNGAPPLVPSQAAAYALP